MAVQTKVAPTAERERTTFLHEPSGGGVLVLVAHAEKVTAYIKNTIGISSKVNIVAPDSLARSQGKAKRVYDKRPKG